MRGRLWWGGAVVVGALGVTVGVGGCGGHPAPPPPVSPAGAGTVETRLFLVGDAGDPAPGGEPVLAALAAQLALDPERSVVVFLGDNLYPDGLPDSSDSWRPEGERRLGAQVDLVRSGGARGFFVPGNHDWGHGWEGVRRQERFIESRGAGSTVLLPRGGCPGPEVEDLGASLRLVFLDTQWWLEPGAEPEDRLSDCATNAKGEVTDSLRGALRSAGPRHVVVVAHHPLESGGPHGGHFDWTWHIFPLRQLSPVLWIPLPVVGSVYPISRVLGVEDQDLTSSVYGSLRDSLRSAFRDHPPLAYAAGHEHNLQVIEQRPDGYLQIVSGAGIYGHLNPTYWLESSRYAARRSGFVRLDILRDGRTRLGVQTVDRSGSVTEVFSEWLN